MCAAAIVLKSPSTGTKHDMSKRKTPRAEVDMPPFEPAAFLETVTKGRVIAAHQKREIIFAQGDPADAVFYIRKGKVKVIVLSKQARKPLLRFWARTNSWAKDA
jgi:CRP-like cAMP-binding protein